jgi:shikimate dehydrogenase
MSGPPPKALVIGYPVKHARSPLIHGYWLDNLKLPGSYGREEVLPGTVASFLHAMPEHGIAGCNITVPHKEEAFTACDRLTVAARAVRAVNTTWYENGVLVGDNTDGFGFLAHLDQTYPGWDAEAPRILILGAGGAARGLIIPLLQRNPREIVICNRTQARANDLVAEIHAAHPGAPLKISPWSRYVGEDALPDLVINTTTQGMEGQPALDFDVAPLPENTIVADIVYVPLETPLLRAAKARGLRTLDGLGMLLHQAIPGFERWFGVRPEVTPGLRAHIMADLAPKKAP